MWPTVTDPKSADKGFAAAEDQRSWNITLTPRQATNDGLGRSSLEHSLKQNKGKTSRRRAGWASPGDITPLRKLSLIGAALTFVSHETWHDISLNGNV